MVTVEVADTVLAFTVRGLVKVFHDQGAGRFRFLVVGVDIGDEHGQGLCAVAEFRRGLLAGVRGVEHHPGVTQVHLGATRRAGWPVTVMLGEAEHGGQPV